MEWNPLKKIISNFKQRPGIKEKLQLSLCREILKKKFGIEEINFSKGKLSLKVKDSSLAQELFLRKEEIKKILNQAIGEELIKEIVIKRSEK